MMWNKFLNLFVILTLFSLLIAPVGGASAQESGPFDKTMPFTSTGDKRSPSKEYPVPSASDLLTITGNAVDDPSFEASSGSTTFWGQSSTNFGSPICTLSGCGNGGGTAGPRSGNVWAWYGGVDFTNPNAISPEIGDVWQNVTFPICGATLEFYFWIGLASAGSDANDFFAVFIDGIAVFAADATERNFYPSYTLVRVDVSSFADGGVHLVEFYSDISDQSVNFNLDDISITGCPSISGNAGVAGATLSYTGGSTIANGSGNYSFDVPPGWSGTVTPSLRCYTFNPANRTYNNVTTNQTAQNYTATVAPTCAAVTVRIKGIVRGTRAIPKGTAERLSFPLEGGPVFVNSPNNVPFVASERVIFPKGSNNPTHFSEMMGLPANLLSTKYSFPAYDNLFFDSQLRFANLGTANTTVIVTIGGVERGRYNLAPNQSDRRSYSGLSSGPVVVQSTGNVPIIASLRVVPRPFNGSFSEMIGLPQNQLATSFIFPWYNNVQLNTQIRVGNVGTATTTVTVTIGGVPRGTFTLAPNASQRVRFTGVNAGPVRVSSSGNVPIVASMRVAFGGGNNFTGFSELMGLPQPQLSSTYHFPWYNNVALDTQLRVANLSAGPATVRVIIGGQEVVGSPFTLAGGASLRKSFAANNGPVKIVANQLVVASLRLIFPKGSNSPTYFSEMMGLPQQQLFTAYYFPWYNNVGLDTQLRLGVP